MTTKKTDLDSEKELRISMDVEFFERLEKIKDYYGIRNNTEIIRFMINDKYRQLFGEKEKI